MEPALRARQRESDPLPIDAAAQGTVTAYTDITS